MRFPLIVLIFSAIFFFNFSTSNASSSYVLPYPSFMPGSIFYKPRLFYDLIMRYWHFGDIAQFKYHLSLSDRYIVEAKTLYEYNQYVLASSALKNSNEHFVEAGKYLGKAQEKTKNTTEKVQLFKDASNKHIEVLNILKKIVPESFVWHDEKKEPVNLLIRREIDQSIDARHVDL